MAHHAIGRTASRIAAAASLVAVAAVALVFAQDARRGAEQRLTDIQHELMRAWIDRDRKKIESLLAPDWRVTGPSGTVTGRAEVLGDVFESRRHRILTGAIGDISVRLIGPDAAVVTGRTSATGTYDGVGYTADIRFTDVFERAGRDWRAVRSHASSVTR